MKEFLSFVWFVIMISFLVLWFALLGSTTTCYEAKVTSKLNDNQIVVYAEEIDFYHQEKQNANLYNHVEVGDNVFLKSWYTKNGEYILSDIYSEYDGCTGTVNE